MPGRIGGALSNVYRSKERQTNDREKLVFHREDDIPCNRDATPIFVKQDIKACYSDNSVSLRQCNEFYEFRRVRDKKVRDGFSRKLFFFFLSFFLSFFSRFFLIRNISDMCCRNNKQAAEIDEDKKEFLARVIMATFTRRD